MSKTILIVSRRYDLAAIAKELLKFECFEIKYFSCANDCLIFFNKYSENVLGVISDDSLSQGFSGLEMIQELHEIDLVPSILIVQKGELVKVDYHGSIILIKEEPYNVRSMVNEFIQSIFD